MQDHCKAILRVLEAGKLGEVYNIGSNNEQTNLHIVHLICDILDEKCPKENGTYRDQIVYVTDRPGHDFRYAIDSTKIETELDWKAEIQFADGLKKTVDWYLDNSQWVERITSGNYQRERLGLS